MTAPGADGQYGTLDDILDPGPDAISGTTDDGGGIAGLGHEKFTITDGVYRVVSAGDDGIEGTEDDIITGDIDMSADGKITTDWHVNRDDSLGATFLLTAQEIHPTTGERGQLASMSFTDNLPTPIQSYYVPLPEADISDAFNDISPNPVTGSIVSQIAISVAAPNTIIYYDHWEDGYDSDVNGPNRQASTLIFGDGDVSNGAAPGVILDSEDVFHGGESIILENNVPINQQNSENNILFDGSDLIQSTAPIAVVRGAYPSTPGIGSFLAGAVEVRDTGNWGDRFIVPVGAGEDTPNSSGTEPFEYTSANVMAENADTEVFLDGVSKGVIGQGKTIFLENVKEGQEITTQGGNIQLSLVTGDVGSNYEMRWYSLDAVSQWSNNYVSPVAEEVGSTGFWFYNPNNTTIEINYEFGGNNPNRFGSFTVDANSSEFVEVDNDGEINLVGVGNPSYSGIIFESAEGESFYALAQIDADNTDGNGQIYDWGFPLLSTEQLTSQAQVGLGFGNTSNDPNIASRSVVWVTAVDDAVITVDFEGDGSRVQTFEVDRLDSLRLIDSVDQNMSGAIITAEDIDGEPVDIAVAWGQDPRLSSGGDAQALDLGTAVLPLPFIESTKTSDFIDNNDNGVLDSGDTIEYTITVLNTGRDHIDPGEYRIVDNGQPLFQNTTYVSGSTYYTFVNDQGQTITQQVLDNLNGSAFPLDEMGFTNTDRLGAAIDGNNAEVQTLTFQVTVNDFENIVSNSVINTGQLFLGNTPVDRFQTVDPLEFNAEIELEKVVTAVDGDMENLIADSAGDVISYEIRVSNEGNLTINNVVVSDPLLVSLSFDESSDTNGNEALDVGEVWIYTGSYTVTQSDLDSNATVEINNTQAGFIDNTASVSATAANGNALSDNDSAAVEILQAPEIALEKVVTAVDGDMENLIADSAGDVISYEIRVSNEGNLTINNVMVSDPLLVSLSFDESSDTNGNEALDVGEVWIYTGSYTVTQADLDSNATVEINNTQAGFIDNTASVSATAANGNALSDNDSASVEIIQMPDLTITKTVERIENPNMSDGGTTVNEAGDVIFYEILIDNTGNISLTNLEINDPLLTLVFDASTDLDGDGELDVNETWRYTGSYTVTQTDLDNNTNYSIELAGESLPEQVTLQIQNPGTGFGNASYFDVEILSTTGAGLVLTNEFNEFYDNWCIDTDHTINNNVTYTANVFSSYEAAGEALVDMPENLDSLNWLLNQGFVGQDAGNNLGNYTYSDMQKAIWTLIDDNPNTNAGLNTADINADRVEQLVNMSLQQGDNFVPENGDILGVILQPVNAQGNTTNQITITEIVLNDIGLTYTDGNIYNAVFVTTDQTPEPEQADVLTPIEQLPEITLDKSVSDVDGVVNGVVDAAGDIINYEITLSNTGNLTINDVNLTDPLIAELVRGMDITGNNDNVLDVGEVWIYTGSYTVTQADLDSDATVEINNTQAGFIDNTASVSATAANGDELSDNDSAAVEILQDPALSLIKVVDRIENPDMSDGGTTVNEVGDVIFYEIHVENTGNLSLTNLEINDPLLTLVFDASTDLDGDGELDVNETWRYTGSYTVTQTDLDNNTNYSIELAGESLPEQVTLQIQNPGTGFGNASYFDVEILSTTGAGLVLTNEFNEFYDNWCIDTDHTINNNVTYTANVFSSYEAAGEALVDMPENLDSLNWLLNQGFVGQDAGNGLGNYTYSDMQKAIWTLIDDNPNTNAGLNTADINADRVEQLVNMSLQQGDNFVPENGDILGVILQPVNAQGNTTNQITITEIVLNDIGLTYTDGNIYNAVFVTTDQTPEPEQADVLTPIEQLPEITLDKSVSDVDGVVNGVVDAAGDIINYEITLSNTGNLTINDVNLTDPLIAELVRGMDITGNNDNVLDVGEVWIYTGSYTVTQADLDSDATVEINNTQAGFIDNTASVSATAANGDELSDNDSAAVEILQDPALSLIKVVDRIENPDMSDGGTTVNEVGDVIFYEIHVENTGNLSLTNLEINDPLLTLVFDASTDLDGDGELDVNETWRYTGSYTVTQTDLDNNTNYSIELAGESLPEQVTLQIQNPGTGFGNASYFDVEILSTTGAGLVLTNEFNEFYDNWCIDTDHTINNNVTYTANVFSSYEAAGEALVDMPENLDSLNWLLNQGFVGQDAGNGLGNYTYSDMQKAIWTLIDDNPNTNAGLNTADINADRVEQLVNMSLQQGDNFVPENGDILGVILQPVNAQGNTTNQITITEIVLNDIGLTYTDGNIYNAVFVTTDQTPEPEQADVLTPIEQLPEITLDKSVSDVDGVVNGVVDAAGDIINYEITLSNTGNLTINDVNLTDPLIAELVRGMDITGNNDNVLDVGEVWIYTGSYTVTQADLDSDATVEINNTQAGFIDNTASVSATAANGDELSDNDSAAVEILQDPALSLIKVVDRIENPDMSDGGTTVNEVGDVIFYEIHVENTGNLSLTNLEINDPLLTLVFDASTDLDGDGELDVNETWRYTGSYTVTQTDLDNNTNYSIELAGESLPEQVTLQIQNPGTGFGNASYFDVEILSTTGAGLVLTNEFNEFYDNWCIDTDHTINNNVTYTANVFSSYEAAGEALVDMPENLDSLNWLLNQGFVGQDAGNGLGNYTYSDMQKAIWTLIDDNPNTNAGLNTADINADRVEQLVNMSLQQGDNFVPENGDILGVILQPVNAQGNTTNQITITEIVLNDIGLTYTDGNIYNAVFVTTDQTPEPEQADVLTPIEQLPEITLDKSVSDVDGVVNGVVDAAGDIINYEITLSNTGNLTINDVNLTDPLIAELVRGMDITGNNDNVLDVGEVWIYTGSYTVTQADLDSDATVEINNTQAGFIDNTASVSATAANGDELSDNDSAAVEILQDPALSLIKVVDRIENPDMSDGGTTVNEVGDVIFYEIHVENTGNLSLTNLEINDPLLTLVFDASTDLDGDGELDVNETWRYTGSYTVTQTDLDNNTNYSIELAGESLPEQVTLQIQNPGTGFGNASYFDVEILSTTGAGLVLTNEFNEFYDNWCIDTDHTINNNVTYTANVFSSYEAAGEALVDMPENLDSLNWLLNQGFVGQDAGNGLGNYTYSDMQKAIWTLIDDNPNTNAGLNTADINADRVEQLVNMSLQQGDNFVPENGDILGVILQPVNAQGNTTNQITITEIVLNDIGLTYTDGNIYNAVFVTTDQTPEPEQADVLTPIEQLPEITLDKSVSDVDGVVNGVVDAAGDIINYEITLSNTGNLTINDVNLTDPLIAELVRGMDITGNNDNVLDVGEVWIYTGSYTVTQADLDSDATVEINNTQAGFIDNTASVSATARQW